MRCGRRAGGLGFLVVGAIALAAGCGGDVGGGSEELGADELTQRAAAICERYQQPIWDIEEPGSVVTTEAVADFMAESARIRSERQDQLEVLAPPQELADRWDEALGLLQRQIDEFQGVADALEGGAGLAEAQAGTSFVRTRGEFEAIAPEVGLEGCWVDDRDS